MLTNGEIVFIVTVTVVVWLIGKYDDWRMR